MRGRDVLLFYCQHSLGLGHLVRSLALAEALGRRFRVVFLNGGPLPKGLKVPAGVEIVNLPPLGMSPEGLLVSRDGRRTVERACESRRRLILEIFRELMPRVVFVELFPFGRKKFAGELLPLLDGARQESAARPVVCCSLRDILVGKRTDQQKHDARAVAIANEFFDAVLVHSDPTFARLEESLSSPASLRVPVHYTGFVQPERTAAPGAERMPQKQILVSAGGGLVGEALFRVAIEAFTQVRRERGVTLKIVAGPFLPEDAWLRLREATKGQTGLSLKQFVPDLCAEMRRSAASLSQCGYNTALDVLRAGVPALVVPFAEGTEDEQSKRARRLESLGALRVLEPHEANAARLAKELSALLDFKPRPLGLDLDGANNTARIVASLVQKRNSRRTARLQKGARAIRGASMSVWLDELRRALDAAPRPVNFFFRDDDAGWADERLFELLDLFERHSTPIDLAAIPSALTRQGATMLRARVEAAPTLVAIHQHGFAHVNHETEGRKCEFGASREVSLQERDIEAGRRMLADMLGGTVDDIFTPPWNRCVAATGERLLRAGFRVLSRDATAKPLGLEGLSELPVTVDWLARRKGVRLTRSEVGAQLAATVSTTSIPLGVMFHHALMDAEELARAGEMLALLSSHRNARLALMRTLVTAPGDAASLSGEGAPRAVSVTHGLQSTSAHAPMFSERNRI